MRSEIGFLNVDLEVGARTRAQLAPFMTSVDGKLMELHHGRIRSLYRAHYEALDCCPYTTTAAIHELARVIESLDARGRRAWRAAAMRDFNVGVELAPGQAMNAWVVEPDAVRRVAALGGRIVFTAYQAAVMDKQTRASRR